MQYNSAYVRAGRTIEKKYQDLYMEANPSAMIFDIVPTLFSDIAGGTKVNQRIGNKVTVTNINFRGEVSGWGPSGGITASNRCRMIVFLDTQCNGLPADIKQILQPPDELGTQTPKIDAYRNMETAPRFRILKDKMMVFNPQGSDYREGANNHTLSNTKVIKFSWKGSLPLHFGSPGAGITELKNNNVGVLFVWEKTAAGHIKLNARVKYTDY